jgi:hypothetical protein
LANRDPALIIWCFAPKIHALNALAAVHEPKLPDQRIQTYSAVDEAAAVARGRFSACTSTIPPAGPTSVGGQ